MTVLYSQQILDILLRKKLFSCGNMGPLMHYKLSLNLGFNKTPKNKVLHFCFSFRHKFYITFCQTEYLCKLWFWRSNFMRSRCLLFITFYPHIQALSHSAMQLQEQASNVIVTMLVTSYFI